MGLMAEQHQQKDPGLATPTPGGEGGEGGVNRTRPRRTAVQVRTPRLGLSRSRDRRAALRGRLQGTGPSKAGLITARPPSALFCFFGRGRVPVGQTWVVIPLIVGGL